MKPKPMLCPALVLGGALLVVVFLCGCAALHENEVDLSPNRIFSGTSVLFKNGMFAGRAIEGVFTNSPASILIRKSDEIVFVSRFNDDSVRLGLLSLNNGQCKILTTFSEPEFTHLTDWDIADARVFNKDGSHDYILVYLRSTEYGTGAKDSQSSLCIYSLDGDKIVPVGKADIGAEDVCSDPEVNSNQAYGYYTAVDTGLPAKESYSKIFLGDVNSDGFCDIIIKTWNFEAKTSRYGNSSNYRLKNTAMSAMLFAPDQGVFLPSKAVSGNRLTRTLGLGMSDAFPAWPVNAPDNL